MCIYMSLVSVSPLHREDRENCPVKENTGNLENVAKTQATFPYETVTNFLNLGWEQFPVEQGKNREKAGNL